MKINALIRRLFGILLIWMISNVGQAQESWRISDDYSIEFSGSGADGTFKGLNGKILFDPEKLEGSQFDVVIDPSSIDTGNKTKDKHARGKSWFHVEKFVNIKFISSKIYSSGQEYVAEGMLTLHGIQKETKITFSYQKSDDKNAVFKGKLKVNRQDFGIEGPFMAFMVGDEFDVSITVNATKN